MFPTPNSDPGKKRPFKINLWWMYAIVLLFLLGIYYLDDNSVTRTVSYSDFESYVVKDHGIRKIVVYTDKRMAEVSSPTRSPTNFSKATASATPRL